MLFSSILRKIELGYLQRDNYATKHEFLSLKAHQNICAMRAHECNEYRGKNTHKQSGTFESYGHR